MASYPAALMTPTVVVDDPGGTEILAAHHNSQDDEILAIETELGTDVAGSKTNLKTRLAMSLADDGTLEFAASTVLTISSGAITVTQNFHRVATEGGAGTDNLDTINGLNNDGAVLFIRPSTANDIVLRDLQLPGNIRTVNSESITLSDTDEWAILVYDTNLSTWMASKLGGGSSVTTNAGAANNYLAVYTGATNIEGTDDLQWNATTLTIGDGTAGVDYAITANGQNSDGTITWMEDETWFKSSAVWRGATSLYRRYQHVSLASANPGGAGATWTVPTANTVGGWQLDAATELLYMNTDIHADWDGATDLILTINFECNVNNTGGGAGDTVDIKAVVYYKTAGDAVTKSQTVEVATVIGQSPQYKQFEAVFTIDWDAASNVLEVGDNLWAVVNLETDTSEVDDIVINDASFYYQTTHASIESGDV